MARSEAERLSFVELMQLERLQGKRREKRETLLATFMSVNPPFEPGFGSAYGGHVYAQAVRAASLTVVEGMVIHNVHGYFTLPGLPDRPFFLEITELSEGKSYCTRSVSVRQPSSPSTAPYQESAVEGELRDICFTCICSFKKDEVSVIGHQMEARLEERYAVVIQGRDPESHEPPPRVDAPWYYRQVSKQPLPNEFHGLNMRKVDMSAYNKSKPSIDYRQLLYYQPLGPIPPTDYNLHACAHLYASDRNSLWVVSNALGFSDSVGNMASLSHSVVFHVSSKELVLREGEWWCQESWTPRSGGGRAMHESRIWGPSGVHVASSWQDGLVRRAEDKKGEKQRIMWFENMKRLGKIPGERGGKEKL